MKDYNTLHSEQERKEYDSEVCWGDLFLHFHPIYSCAQRDTTFFFPFFSSSKISLFDGTVHI